MGSEPMPCIRPVPDEERPEEPPNFCLMRSLALGGGRGGGGVGKQADGRKIERQIYTHTDTDLYAHQCR